MLNLQDSQRNHVCSMSGRAVSTLTDMVGSLARGRGTYGQYIK